MAKRTNIVSFEDARTNNQKRRRKATDFDSPDSLSQQAQPRSAITASEDFLEESTSESLSDKLDKSKRSRRKAKAERAYEKTYGAAEKSSQMAAASASAPRPAVYKGEMGASHRRAAKMQSSMPRTARSSSSSFALPSFDNISRKMMVVGASIAFIVLVFATLYSPAQQYYHQVREHDRLEAEYEALADRNDTLQKNVDSLESDSGIEDKAHAEFGYVRNDEKAGAVTGIKVESGDNFKANVTPGSVPAPDTWYSDFLDIFFMYSG